MTYMKIKTNKETTLKGPDDFATVGEYLCKLREAKDLTLRTVVESTKAAIKCGKLDPQSAVSRGYLSNLESGKYLHPSPLKLKALAFVYQIPNETLLNKAGYLDKTSGKLKQDSSFTLMLKEVQDMTNSEKESVMDYIGYVKTRRRQKYDKSPKKG